MALSSKDAVATFYVAAAGGYLAWHLSSPHTAFVGSPRWTAAVVLVLGMTACGTGSRMQDVDRFLPVIGVLAAVPFLLMLTVLVTNDDRVLVAYVASVGVVWLASTMRHALMRTPAHEAPTAAPAARERELTPR